MTNFDVDTSSGHALAVPKGFLAGAMHCGIKKRTRPDLGLLVSTTPCSAAWASTTNQVVAAPVLVSLEHLKQNPSAMRALVLNSGNANAVTGPQGLLDARTMCVTAAQGLSNAGLTAIAPEQIVVMSTGVIGQPLPMAKILEGLPQLCRGLGDSGHSGASAFVDAMMTTDTRPKHALIQRPGWSLGGATKGSGMIHPNMATMLAVITTDALVDHNTLQRALHHAVRQSFNRISVDGDTSTNDMVVVLANGASGLEPSADEFQGCLTDLCTELAQMIVRDGEGASKFVTIRILGAATEDAAEAFARTIATSPLAKTSWFGQDANWGRILAAAGRAGPALDPNAVSLRINGIDLLHQGQPLPVSEADGNRALEPTDIVIELTVGQGPATVSYWTCDLSYDYVKINASYRS
jgi:glutamate N-acetyltransferase/amino-acid N-acetyltransferase